MFQQKESKHRESRSEKLVRQIVEARKNPGFRAFLRAMNAEAVHSK